MLFVHTQGSSTASGELDTVSCGCASRRFEGTAPPLADAVDNSWLPDRGKPSPGIPGGLLSRPNRSVWGTSHSPAEPRSSPALLGSKQSTTASTPQQCKNQTTNERSNGERERSKKQQAQGTVLDTPTDALHAVTHQRAGDPLWEGVPGKRMAREPEPRARERGCGGEPSVAVQSRVGCMHVNLNLQNTGRSRRRSRDDSSPSGSIHPLTHIHETGQAWVVAETCPVAIPRLPDT